MSQVLTCCVGCEVLGKDSKIDLREALQEGQGAPHTTHATTHHHHSHHLHYLLLLLLLLLLM